MLVRTVRTGGAEVEYIKKLCLKVERGLEFRGFLLLHGVLSHIVNISHSLAWISH
jgi:hypothetical protein